jgi:hypothetical protein
MESFGTFLRYFLRAPRDVLLLAGEIFRLNRPAKSVAHLQSLKRAGAGV